MIHCLIGSKRALFHNFFQKSRIFLLFLTMFLASGCFALFLGAGAVVGVVYVKGKLVQNVDYPVSEVHQQGLFALKDLGVYVFDDELNVHSANISGEFEDGEAVLIEIIALTDKTSEIRIRVGVFGHRIRSQKILNTIIDKL